MFHANPILYRPNVAAILQREDGKILVAERINIAGAWQFPQGGVDDGETHEQALFRELEEEIGVQKHLLSILDVKGGYRYAFPKGRLKYGIYGGQEQTYYLCRYTGTDADIHLDATHREFATFRWILPSEFRLDWTPRFKQAVYRQVMRDFFQVEPVA
ncbi:MAG: NUDIX domain-containing protein [Verrucomicrobiaceae bacterium]|nr:NUDIX domain-containing protein [Verrucomicrobiaceae bacterium]